MESIHLNLKKEWFDLILSGKKQYEYRALTYYWANRFFDLEKSSYSKEEIKEDFEGTPIAAAICLTRQKLLKPFKSITFSNGMKAIEILPRFEIVFEGLSIGPGKKELGAKEGEMYFCLKLGSIKNKMNC